MATIYLPGSQGKMQRFNLQPEPPKTVVKAGTPRFIICGLCGKSGGTMVKADSGGYNHQKCDRKARR